MAEMMELNDVQQSDVKLAQSLKDQGRKMGTRGVRAEGSMKVNQVGTLEVAECKVAQSASAETPRLEDGYPRVTGGSNTAKWRRYYILCKEKEDGCRLFSRRIVESKSVEVARVRRLPLPEMVAEGGARCHGATRRGGQRGRPKMVDGRRRWGSQRHPGGDGQQPEMGVVAESGEERRE
ncbi:hypothetical protein Acr_24g0005760 [Actinidia rufa]|uniref:Uncharacterized protein n=1 Tax=Actinidia rufa TaxID=165716 RepID=A0A7J0GUC2_9ERIC|nr:hypothetical protein Acr_24g0005760 [Actinidia rufa]